MADGTTLQTFLQVLDRFESANFDAFLRPSLRSDESYTPIFSIRLDLWRSRVKKARKIALRASNDVTGALGSALHNLLSAVQSISSRDTPQYIEMVRKGAERENFNKAFDNLETLWYNFLVSALENSDLLEVSLNDFSVERIESAFQSYQEQTRQLVLQAQEAVEKARAERDEARKIIEHSLSSTSAVAVSDLGRFYSGESRAQSRWFKPPFPYIGGAQAWIILGFLALGILASAIVALSNPVALPWPLTFISKLVAVSIPSSMDSSKETAWYNSPFLLSLVHAVLFISILVFIVRVCFRQFNVRMHLRTLNERRAILSNTLEDFLKSARAEEAEIRQAIVLEVVKSMANADATGYVDPHTPEINFPMITEPLRAVREIH